MRQPTGRPRSRQPIRPLIINSIDEYGIHRLVIPPNLIGHPALSPFIPPDTPERFRALRVAVNRLQGAVDGVADLRKRH